MLGRSHHQISTRFKILSLFIFYLVTISCTAPKPPEGKVRIEFWDFPRLPAVSKWLEESIAEFEKQNPDIEVEYTRLSWSKGLERLDIAAFARRPPDVAGGVLQLKYVEAGLVVPVDEYLDEPMPDSTITWREDIHPGFLKSVQWEGKTWAFPWYKEGFILLFNKKILEERGVALPDDGRWTWDEFIATMRELTFDRDGDGKVDVYGIGFSTGNEKWEAFPFLIAEGMQIVSDDGRTSLIDSDATRRGLNCLLQMEYEEKVSLPGAGGMMDDVTWTAFSGRDRRLASTSQGLWAIKSVISQNERALEFKRQDPNADTGEPLEVEIMNFPQMPGQPQTMTSYGTGAMMVFDRPADRKRTEAALKFARFITLEVGQEINKEAGVFPSRKSVGNIYGDDPLYKNIAPLVPDAVTPPVHPVWLQMDQVISEQVQLILLRRVSVDEGVKRMGERTQVILDAYWESQDAALEEAGQ